MNDDKYNTEITNIYTNNANTVFHFLFKELLNQIYNIYTTSIFNVNRRLHLDIS